MSKYYKLSNDIDDLKDGDGKEKATAGLKILGKSIFNAGKFTVTEFLPELNKRIEEEKAKK